MDVNIYIQALQPQQTSKSEANYRPLDTTSQHCGNCTYMNDDGSCQLVLGQVDPEHVCDLWEKEQGR